MFQVLFIIAVALLPGVAQAKPLVGAVTWQSLDTIACRVYFQDKKALPGAQVLFWTGQLARMHVDGQVQDLFVHELPCRDDCVFPGASGYRVFQFSNKQIQATLRKSVTCAAISEVCSGLPEGPAQLTVKSSAGRIVLPVRTDYCDL